jgi:nucleoside-diphosphate-sugar epimerase
VEVDFMVVTVTGGSGFIGSTLCSLLRHAGKSFQIVDVRGSQMFPDEVQRIDIRDKDRLAQYLSSDTLIHLAAVHRDDVKPVSQYESVNVEGTRNICRAASIRGVKRIVFTSSVAVYGFADIGTGEDGRINPFNEYGRTKFAAEEVLRSWQSEQSSSRSVTIVRPTVVFGPGNRGNVYNLFSQIVSRRFAMIGQGENVKSMAYVDNVAAFLLRMASNGPGVHIHNYVDKPDLTMNELVTLVRKTVLGQDNVGFRLPLSVGLPIGYAADLFSKFTGKSLPVSSIRVKKFSSNTSFSSSAHDVSGFTAPVSLTEGIARTLKAEFISPDISRPIFITE